MKDFPADRIATSIYKRLRPGRWRPEADQVTEPRLQLAPGDIPRYAVDRLAVALSGRVQGEDRPWLTQEAVGILDELLRPSDVGLEYGSGGSTVWLARRVLALTSVESSDSWCATTRARLDAAGITNVELLLASADDLGHGTPEHRVAFFDAAADLAPGSLDFVLVDAEYRDEAALLAVTLLRPGGLLIVDNVDLYLPTTFRSPWKVDRPLTARWEAFAAEVADWRRLGTTNGVWDTAIWLKP